jgi:hypothetical protein
MTAAARFILPGSRADLAERAGALPVYVTGQFDLRQEVLDRIIGGLGAQMPAAEIIAARGLYDDLDDWKRRWPAEGTLYGAAVVVTSGGPVEMPDGLTRRQMAEFMLRPPFRGGHVVSLAVEIEIASFVAMRRPVAWLGLEFPSSRWLSKFAVESDLPLGWIAALGTETARLYPAADADHFAPIMSAAPPPQWSTSPHVMGRHARARPRRQPMRCARHSPSSGREANRPVLSPKSSGSAKRAFETSFPAAAELRQKRPKER